MFSPMPCRVLEAPRSLPTSPGPRSPGDISDTSADFTTARPIWYESGEATEDFDEATKDLREDLGCCKASMIVLPDFLPALTRCLSSASTTASLSPGPPPPVSLASSPDRDLGAATSPSPPHSFVSPPSSPDRNRVASPDLLDNDIEAPTQNQQPQCPPGALDKSSWSQARKVFVGGIPQTIDQNTFFHMFSKFGKVKKAWLQLFHNDRTSTSFQDPAAKKHRGFGFIIFYERGPIDELLGTAYSRVVTFNDMTLEVKRSVGKTCAATPEPPNGMGPTKREATAASASAPAASAAPVLAMAEIEEASVVVSGLSGNVISEFNFGVHLPMHELKKAALPIIMPGAMNDAQLKLFFDGAEVDVDDDISLAALGIEASCQAHFTAVMYHDPHADKRPCPGSGWQYLDPTAIAQGPFTLAEMQIWHSMGYFRAHLLMRCDPNDPFVEFIKLFPPPLTAFESYPRVTCKLTETSRLVFNGLQDPRLKNLHTPAFKKTSFAAPQTWQSSSASPAPQTWQRSPPAASPPQTWQNASPAGLQQSPQIAVPVMPQMWQQGPRQMVLVGFQAYSPLPSVPAFPFAEASAVVLDQMTSHVIALPGAISRGANPVPTTNCQFLPEVFLKRLLVNDLKTHEELKMALMEALPDHYDD